VIHLPTAPLIDLHRRAGDARLFRALSQYSVGQSEDALLHILDSRRGAPTAAAARLADDLSSRETILLTILDAEYPACLRALDTDAPPFLYVIGTLSWLKARSIAIIGTRNPSAVGRASAKTVSHFVARSGWCVVSGNAPGVDAAAHSEAVKSGGSTLIFPPVPMDQYKQAFRGHYPDQITVASCFAPGIGIEPYMFLRRNTLVARHCQAAFVAETGTRGGTLDTIKKLRRFERPVFATDLPEDASHCKAHAMLAAGGGELIDTSDGCATKLSPIIAAAENCRQGPVLSTPVLDDLFPEEFVRDE